MSMTPSDRARYARLRADPEVWNDKKAKVRERRKRGSRDGHYLASPTRKPMPQPNVVAGIPLSRLMAGR